MSTPASESDDANLRRDAARRALSLSFTEHQLQRMRELAEKARQGELTLDEHDELECYERTGSLLGVLQSKARSILEKADLG